MVGTILHLIHFLLHLMISMFGPHSFQHKGNTKTIITLTTTNKFILIYIIVEIPIKMNFHINFRYFGTFFIWIREETIEEVMEIFDSTVLHCDQYTDYGIYHPNK